MKRSWFSLAVVFAMLFVVSCRKRALSDGVNCTGNCYILTGRLIDSAANAGIAGGEIKFFHDPVGIFSNRIYIGRTITDANGNYTFRFDGTRFNDSTQLRQDFFAEAYKGDMFAASPTLGHRVAGFFLDTSMYNVPFVQNFALFRPATLKIRIIAPNGANYQYLTVEYNFGKRKIVTRFPGGKPIDTTFTWKTAGDLKTFIYADAVGNGINIQKRDTIIIPANATRQVELTL